MSWWVKVWAVKSCSLYGGISRYWASHTLSKRQSILKLHTVSKTQNMLKPEWPEFDADVSEKIKFYGKS